MALINTPPQNAVDTMDKGRLAPPSEGWRNFFQSVFAICNAVTLSGPTAERPSTLLWLGRVYWDSTLQIPVYYSGGGVWKNSAGAPV